MAERTNTNGATLGFEETLLVTALALLEAPIWRLKMRIGGRIPTTHTIVLKEQPEIGSVSLEFLQEGTHCGCNVVHSIENRQ